MKNKSKLTMALAMAIFGTIGLIRRNILLSSSLVSMFRGFIGGLILLLYVLVSKKKISFSSIKKNWWKLLISGGFLGFNWICLFEAYNYTTVATATLCYYMAPVIVMLLSPFFFKEKLTIKRICIVVISLLGMAFVSGVISQGSDLSGNGFKGVMLGLLAALMYAGLVIFNKKTDIGPYEKTISQLITAAIILFPYVLVTDKVGFSNSTSSSVLFLIVAGILHTGIAYLLYFKSMEGMDANSIALYSYIDPVVAILLSAIVLKEPMGLLKIIGAVLILGSTLLGEISGEKQ